MLSYALLYFIVAVAAAGMTLQLLLTPEQLGSKPDTVRLVENYGRTSIIVTENGHKLPSFSGSHVIVSGEVEDISAWLRPYDGVYVENGIPMMEQFQLMHIK